MLFPEIQSVKERRRKLGIKQQDLALLSGVSQSLIAKLESGKVEPSYSIVKKIFTSLDSLEFKNERKCEDLMNSEMISVSQNEKVKHASELMKKKDVSQIPVFDGKRVVGMITESIILDKVIEGTDKEKLLNLQVKEIMSASPPIVPAESPISVVLPLLKTSGALLVTKKDKVVGIITKADVL